MEKQTAVLACASCRSAECYAGNNTCADSYTAGHFDIRVDVVRVHSELTHLQGVNGEVFAILAWQPLADVWAVRVGERLCGDLLSERGRDLGTVATRAGAIQAAQEWLGHQILAKGLEVGLSWRA